jgi:ABC-type polysaccharide/polyol phosphate transport system ATPase subunit
MAKIELRNAYVKFPVFSPKERSIKTAIKHKLVGGALHFEKEKAVYVEALNNISMRLGDGVRLGIMGHNGSGKTTLLRLLAGIYEPTEGSITRSGSVYSVTDMLMGMDPEESGYDNIIMRGIFMGLTHKQAKSLIPDVEEFTELGEFLSMPVRTYSTGMMLRLAFAISTSVQSDILIMDEMIGAGDAAFMEKALKRTEEFLKKTSILIIASHNPQTVLQFCNAAILLEKGYITRSGKPEEIIQAYVAAAE